jgi:hypothetical protein
LTELFKEYDASFASIVRKQSMNDKVRFLTLHENCFFKFADYRRVAILICHFQEACFVSYSLFRSRKPYPCGIGSGQEPGGEIQIPSSTSTYPWRKAYLESIFSDPLQQLPTVFLLSSSRGFQGVETLTLTLLTPSYTQPLNRAFRFRNVPLSSLYSSLISVS